MQSLPQSLPRSSRARRRHALRPDVARKPPLWRALSGRRLEGVQFRRQVVLANRFIVDFLAPRREDCRGSRRRLSLALPRARCAPGPRARAARLSRRPPGRGAGAPRSPGRARARARCAPGRVAWRHGETARSAASARLARLAKSALLHSVALARPRSRHPVRLREQPATPRPPGRPSASTVNTARHEEKRIKDARIDASIQRDAPTIRPRSGSRSSPSALAGLEHAATARRFLLAPATIASG